jgi:hypothetical protein
MYVENAGCDVSRLAGNMNVSFDILMTTKRSNFLEEVRTRQARIDGVLELKV